MKQLTLKQCVVLLRACIVLLLCVVSFFLFAVINNSKQEEIFDEQKSTQMQANKNSMLARVSANNEIGSSLLPSSLSEQFMQ